MTDTLSQWEADAALINPNNGESNAIEVHLATRILALIDLIKNKDEILYDIQVQMTPGDSQTKAFIARELTEKLK